MQNRRSRSRIFLAGLVAVVPDLVDLAGLFQKKPSVLVLDTQAQHPGYHAPGALALGGLGGEGLGFHAIRIRERVRLASHTEGTDTNLYPTRLQSEALT